jgi:hypothetical protein
VTAASVVTKSFVSWREFPRFSVQIAFKKLLCSWVSSRRTARPRPDDSDLPDRSTPGHDQTTATRRQRPAGPPGHDQTTAICRSAGRAPPDRRDNAANNFENPRGISGTKFRSRTHLYCAFIRRKVFPIFSVQIAFKKLLFRWAFTSLVPCSGPQAHFFPAGSRAPRPRRATLSSDEWCRVLFRVALSQVVPNEHRQASPPVCQSLYAMTRKRK